MRSRRSSPGGDPSIVCVPMDGKLVFCLETVDEEDEAAPRRADPKSRCLTSSRLSEAEVRSLVGPPEALAAMRTAFAALYRGEVTQPAIMDLEFPEAQGEAHLKGAHIHGAPHWAVKAATGFWSNVERGLPVTSGFRSSSPLRPAS